MGINSINGLIAGQLANTQRLFGLIAGQIATGDRLANSPAFDPAAFIASERLRTQLAGLESSSRTVQLGRAITSLADSNLASVSGQLDGIRTLVLQSSVANGEDKLALDAAIQASVNQITGQLASPFFGQVGGSGSSFSVSTDPSNQITNLALTQTPSPVPTGGFDLDIVVNALGATPDVTVNGVAARVENNVARFTANGFAGSFSIDPATAPGTAVTLTVQSGGITVATDGSGGTLTFGVPAFSGDLGASSGVGSLARLTTAIGSVSTDDRIAILDAARSEVITGRAQIGRVDSGLANAGSAIENQISGISSAVADLRSVDLASAILDLTRAQVQAELQTLLLRENNVTQASILRLLTGQD